MVDATQVPQDDPSATTVDDVVQKLLTIGTIYDLIYDNQSSEQSSDVLFFMRGMPFIIINVLIFI